MKNPMGKQPIGLAIAFTVALSLMTHQPAEEPTTQQAQAPATRAIPAQALTQSQDSSSQAASGPSANSPSVSSQAEQTPTEKAQPEVAEPRNEPAYRIASLVPGVERLLKTTAGN